MVLKYSWWYILYIYAISVHKWCNHYRNQRRLVLECLGILSCYWKCRCWHNAWCARRCWALEVKLLLQHYIFEEELLSLEQLNERIASYNGYLNTKNKPSVIPNPKSETPIKQTASQMWCLILNLPFLLEDLVNPESLHWQLFILLREICSIIFAPVVTRGLAVFLKRLIIDHHKLFKELYPAKNLTPNMMIKCGPLSKLWCMRFESKHNPLKWQTHAVCNF